MSIARAQLTASVDLINAFATLGEVNEEGIEGETTWTSGEAFGAWSQRSA